MKDREYEDMFYGRLRSARRRKRKAYDDSDKQLLRLYREGRAIGKLAPVWIPLEHPYQRGWERFFVLRDDVKRDSRAAFYQKILDKINTRQMSRRKDFKKRTQYRGRKRYAAREQELSDVCVKDFMSKKFTDRERALFIPVVRHIRSLNIKYFDYRFAEPWRFVLKVMPNMVTHTLLKNNEMESRDAYIDAVLRQDNHEQRLRKLLDGSYQYKCDWCNDDPVKRGDPFHNRSFAAVLDEYWPSEAGRDIKILPTREDFSFYGFCGTQKECAGMGYLWNKYGLARCLRVLMGAEEIEVLI